MRFKPVLRFVPVLLVAGWGSAWAFTRGGDDFRVFYHAWSLVLSGQGALVYQNSPDRFLYAPGFAWVLAPFALLPEPLALGLWCALKAAVLAWVVIASVKALSLEEPLAAFAPWGVVLLVRPLLIDFQYGQVNLFILGACLWPVLGYFRDARLPARASANYFPSQLFRSGEALPWAVLAMAAIAKLFPLPLLLIPFFKPDSPKQKPALWGLALGSVLMLLLPGVTEGGTRLVSLYPQWWQALESRGLPLESHNQSFAAFLYHYLSGLPTEIIAQHHRAMRFGWTVLSTEQIRYLSAAWMAASLGFIMRLLTGRSPMDFRRIAFLLALLVVPSHLVWKPYFSMGLPLALAVMTGLGDSLSRKPNRSRVISILIAFALMNLTGFDFVGLDWGARLEAASLMLFAYLLIFPLALNSFPFRASGGAPSARAWIPRA